jgi:hypothetical protein
MKTNDLDDGDAKAVSNIRGGYPQEKVVLKDTFKIFIVAMLIWYLL